MLVLSSCFLNWDLWDCEGFWDFVVVDEAGLRRVAVMDGEAFWPLPSPRPHPGPLPPSGRGGTCVVVGGFS